MKNSIIDTVIVFLRHEDKILLAIKKRGFGAGRYNGVGGKLEPSETPKQCARRETAEEICVKPASLTQVADLTFHEHHKGVPETVHSYVYVCTDWEGEPVETDEITPQWFDLTELPYDSMWSDDKYWLPKVIAGEKVTGVFRFDENNLVIDHKVTQVDSSDEQT